LGATDVEVLYIVFGLSSIRYVIWDMTLGTYLFPVMFVPCCHVCVYGVDDMSALCVHWVTWSGIVSPRYPLTSCGIASCAGKTPCCMHWSLTRD
jgi:hypothetical protein